MSQGELPKTVDYDTVSATIIKKTAKHDQKAHEASLKRVKGQLPEPAGLANMLVQTKNE